MLYCYLHYRGIVEKSEQMTRNAVYEKSLHEGLITALSIGGFFIILGLVFAITPGISQQTNNFFSDLTTVAFPFGNPGSTVSFLAPSHPADHQGFYTAVMNFLIGVGVLQILILVLRLAVHSRINRIAQSVGDSIFWLGAAVIANIFLLRWNAKRLVPVLVSVNNNYRYIPGCKVLRLFFEKGINEINEDDYFFCR